MRTLASFLVVTVDGYYVGANQEFDWPVVDDEFNEFALRQLDASDLLIFGRTTYEGMAQYWPTPAAKQDDPAVYSRMNGLPKVVVSRSLEQPKPQWANTTLIKDVRELTRRKQGNGKDLLVLGSSALTTELMRLRMLDELRLMVNPIILGAGASVFHTATERIPLKQLAVRTFGSGNVLLTFQPATQVAGG